LERPSLRKVMDNLELNASESEAVLVYILCPVDMLLGIRDATEECAQ